MNGSAYLLLSGICLGTIGIFVKLIGPNISPYLLATIRIISAAALIFIFLASDRRTSLLRLRRGDLKIFIVSGFFGVVLGFGFFVKSLTLIPVANAVLLMYIYPVSTAILAAAFLNERIGRYAILALLMTLAGIYLIYGHGASISASGEGSFYALTAGLGYSVFIISMRYMEKSGHNFWDVVFWPLLLGGIMLVPFNLTERIVFLPFDNIVILVLGMIFISTLLGYLFYARGLRTIQAKHATIIETLAEPTTAVFLAWLILGEAISPFIFMGGTLIILANLVVRLDINEDFHKKRI